MEHNTDDDRHDDQAQHPSSEDLDRVPLFAGLTREARDVLAGGFVVEEFGRGRRLVVEGRSGYSFFVLARGQVAVEQDGRTVRTLEPGAFFGEIAILGPGRRTATVVSTEPGAVWSLDAAIFRRLQEQRPDVAVALQEAMRERLASDGTTGTDADR